ncbi:Polypeptide release factor 3 [Trachipleistophora hominis]|uniref:Polypeptide release factor 3 n=1 Tax=Trachipleistophora hominis TaxID=72359 RepID=L7JVW9_TRAHO|nr:Polypeptide release factor 3 [Trachipleistophora hominis]
MPMSHTKPTISVVFIGHVDAGKSTLSGRILLSLNLVDPRLLEKYKEESRSLNRESWYLSWLTDTSPAEREKGKTLETCSTILELPHNRVNLLDTPGHKLYLTDMIRGANQADVAVLVISARKGEFEAGFERSGQTREHVILAKAGGVRHCICVINKMDERGFSARCFKEIVGKLDVFLRRIFKEVVYVPVSGYEGVNVLYDGEFKGMEGRLDGLGVRMDEVEGGVTTNLTNDSLSTNLTNNLTNGTNNNSNTDTTNGTNNNTTINNGAYNITGSNYNEINEHDPKWYRGDSLLGLLNKIRIERPQDSTMLTILDKTRNTLQVKVESGTIRKNDELFALPGDYKVCIGAVHDDEDVEIEDAHAGDIVKIRVNTDMLEIGNVLACRVHRCTDTFTCQLNVLECKGVLSVGYRAVLHLKMNSVVVKVLGLQVKKGDKVYKAEYVRKGEKVLGKVRIDRKAYVKEGDCFAIRDEDITVAIGVVRKVL